MYLRRFGTLRVSFITELVQERAAVANPKRIGDFLNEIDEIERAIYALQRDVIPGVKVYQTAWHLKGLVYHARRITELFSSFGQKAAERVQLADFAIFYSPEYQECLYELYSLVVMAKVTLDRIHTILRPLFHTDLPNSISDFKPGYTNCPLYERLSADPFLQYLIDLRD